MQLVALFMFFHMVSVTGLLLLAMSVLGALLSNTYCYQNSQITYIEGMLSLKIANKTDELVADPQRNQESTLSSKICMAEEA